ncbi:aminotransferase, class V [Shewanella denitrificans OS217]|uniref:Aminotransferase, class V n=1 Tax=Shewanella denitrificans (strain OS217 / ATCC BAA-1090 / DSM 15013) TaxID=318161 RepID=Q12IJ9_SHEDO|nr:aminotransferase class V-fold PLP-dependent enzyme [Shewanella denitrificans]ABE56727.1 aminotransferase, class V [Shewanella denitrificans OS217]
MIMTAETQIRSYKQDFCLPKHGVYLLSHSVGRPLITSHAAFVNDFFSPWQEGNTEPWGQWLAIITEFQQALATLFNHKPECFCPQVNLSSALCKLVMSHPRLRAPKAQILMSEQDFPSMGFALSRALPDCDIRFIPQKADITDIATWQQYMQPSISLVFISQVYSNTGQQAPVAEIVDLSKQLDCLSLVDVAQSAGIINLDLQQLDVDFMIGSAVKWLCAGPGAAYLWVNPKHLTDCEPVDVGWFSHENPFEFNIHDFRYHPSALRFWGGTPSIAPYALAAHSIGYFNQQAPTVLQAHNQHLVDKLIQAFPQQLNSPTDTAKRSGTVILDFKDKQTQILNALKAVNIAVDARCLGVRVSPHLYNDLKDIEQFIDQVTQSLS